MSYQLAECSWVKLGKQCHLSPSYQRSFSRRHVQLTTSSSSATKSPRQRPEDSKPTTTQKRGYSSLPVNPPDSPATGQPPAQQVAILGGGITGLASAYYLSKSVPSANITLYESTERWGGWLNSKHVNIGDGKIVFEQGPRSLRPGSPAGLFTVDLARKLGLQDEILKTPESSVAAQKRYIYYPDRLVQMPGPGQTYLSILQRILTEPVFKGLIPGMALEFRRSAPDGGVHDESIGSFLQRRLGNTHVGDNLVSAILHGIYAGDINQLSIISLGPLFRVLESRHGSLSAGIIENVTTKSKLVLARDLSAADELPPLEVLEPNLKSAAIFSFKKGIGQLTDTLVKSLESNPMVRFNTGKPVEKVNLNGESGMVEISIGNKLPPTRFDHVISTIPGRALSHLTEKPEDLQSLQGIHAVTVMVVNLYYTNPSLLPAHGFGYLIPRSVPWDQNPERALGVVFDSDALAGQDTVTGTKVTVMLGGHWWDDFISYPDEEEGAAMAKAILARHLKIVDEPAVINVSLQRDCIPQYNVGHNTRLKTAHHELLKTFRGKLAVAGSSYTGVSVNDCIRAASDIVKAIKAGQPGGVTGLEGFVNGLDVVMVSTMVPPKT